MCVFPSTRCRVRCTPMSPAPQATRVVQRMLVARSCLNTFEFRKVRRCFPSTRCRVRCTPMSPAPQAARVVQRMSEAHITGLNFKKGLTRIRTRDITRDITRATRPLTHVVYDHTCRASMDRPTTRGGRHDSVRQVNKSTDKKTHKTSFFARRCRPPAVRCPRWRCR